MISRVSSDFLLSMRHWNLLNLAEPRFIISSVFLTYIYNNKLPINWKFSQVVTTVQLFSLEMFHEHQHHSRQHHVKTRLFAYMRKTMAQICRATAQADQRFSFSMPR